MIINFWIIIYLLLLTTIATSCQWYQYAAGGTCCNGLVPGCGACASSEWACSSCPSTKCLESNRCSVTCSSRLSYCSTCSSCTSCLTCTSNQYTISSAQCVLCSSLMPTCSTCSSETVCLSCIDNLYAINASTCTLCSSLISNCNQCSSSTVCTSCINNSFVLSSGSCPACSTLLTGCQQCSSSTTCTLCSNAYILNSTTCTSCSAMIANCQDCTSAGTCTTCISGYKYDSNTSTCRSCPNGCSTCDSSFICTSCLNNSLAINSTVNQCVACQLSLEDCLTCTSSTICSSCVNNSLAVSNSTSQCTLCSLLLTDCSTCSSFDACTTCSSNAFVVNSSVCISCGDLMNACLNCTSTTTCINCINQSFVLNSTQCVACSSFMVGCANCTSNSVCTNCVNSTFTLNPTTNQCQTPVSCIDNSETVNVTSNRCVQCSNFMSFCSNCNDNSTCITCQVNSNVVLNNLQCVYCNTIIPNCLNCTSNSFCTLCKKYYAVHTISSQSANCILCGNVMGGCRQCSSETVCTSCSSGQLVANGCSVVPGCVSVLPKQTTSFCLTCNTSLYQANAINGVCICLRGHLAGQYCTEIVGCTNVLRTVSGEVCSICDKGKHFALLNGTCVCEAYYEIQGQTCGDICGDGKVLTLPCDDGNLIDSDGCSSTCQIEPSYICKPNAVGKSSCLYKGWVQLGLNCINKLQNNTAEIVVDFSAVVSNILKSDFTNKIYLNSDKKCRISNFTLTSSSLQVSISYEQDIQGSFANLTVQFDQNYILSPNSTLAFQFTQCNGDRLIYDPDSSQSSKQLIIMTTKLISLLVVLAWLVGSYAHKMIGVQILHTFHLIFITQAFSKRYSPVIINFGELHHTFNLYQQFLTNQAFISQRPYSRLKYYPDFINNNAILVIVQLIVIFLFTLLIFLKKVFNKSKDTKFQKYLPLVAKYKNMLYDFLTFPLFIGFYLNLVISLLIQSNVSIDKLQNSLMQGFSAFFMVTITFFIFFSEWKYLMVEDSKKLQIYRKMYVPLYLTNIFLLSAVIQASFFSFIDKPLYYISSLELVYSLTLFFYRPYKNCIHNLSIIMNQLGIILNLAWIISQEFIYFKRSNEQLIAFGMFIWMFLILIFSTIRIIYQIRRNRANTLIKQQKAKKMGSSVKNEKNQQELLNELLKQASKQINSYRINQQLAREKLLQNLEEKQRKNLKIQFLKSKIRFLQNEQDDQESQESQESEDHYSNPKQMRKLMRQLRDKYNK